MTTVPAAHHSAQQNGGPARTEDRPAGLGEEGHEDKHDAPRRQKPPPPQRHRPALLPEVAGWQSRVQRHTVEQIVDRAPMVQILDVNRWTCSRISTSQSPSKCPRSCVHPVLFKFFTQDRVPHCILPSRSLTFPVSTFKIVSQFSVQQLLLQFCLKIRFKGF